MKNILVIGATGPQGRPVVEKLLKAGYAVRALVRDAAKAEEMALLGVDVVQGDLNDEASILHAMQGQEGVFLLISFITGTAAQASSVIKAAVSHGVKKIVWNTTGPIVPFDTGNPSIDMRRQILSTLQDSGLSFAALQPTVYMENFLIPAIAEEVAQENVLAYPMPEAVLCQWISHQDAAAYVVAAFKNDSAEQLVMEICGPERLSGSQIADRFSKALGRTITFRSMPPEAFAQAISFGGNEASVIQYYTSVFENPAIMTTNIGYDHVLDTLPITPLTVEGWVHMYRHVFSNI